MLFLNTHQRNFLHSKNYCDELGTSLQIMDLPGTFNTKYVGVFIHPWRLFTVPFMCEQVACLGACAEIYIIIPGRDVSENTVHINSTIR